MAKLTLARKGGGKPFTESDIKRQITLFKSLGITKERHLQALGVQPGTEAYHAIARLWGGKKSRSKNQRKRRLLLRAVAHRPRRSVRSAATSLTLSGENGK